MYNKTSYYLERMSIIDYTIRKGKKRTRKLIIPFLAFFICVSLASVIYISDTTADVFDRFFISAISLFGDVFCIIYLIKPEIRTKRYEKRARVELNHISRDEFFEVCIEDKKYIIRKSDNEKIYQFEDIKKLKFTISIY